MAIRFITAWNGYHGQQIVDGLGSTEEARLISLGFAVADLDGPDNSPVPAFTTTNASGATVLVGADGEAIPLNAAGVGKSIACLGDSITYRNQVSTANNTGYDTRGYMTWANALLGNKRMWFPVANNFGYAGETSDTIKTHVSEVVALQPDYCVVLASINDIATGLPFATIKANLQEIWDGLLAGGVTPIAMTIWPEESSTVTADERKVKYRVNTFIRESALRDKRILLCDPFPLMVDQTSATGAPLANYMFNDATDLHPTALGAYWAGYALKQLLDSILPATPTVFSTQADVFDATYNPTGNLLVNGLLDGVGGTETGAGVTGDTATSWTLYRTGATGGGTSTCVGSKTTKTLANGQTIPAQTFTVDCSLSGADERFMIYQYINTGASTYAPGDQVYAEIVVDVASLVNLNYLKFQVVDELGAQDETYIDLYYLLAEAGKFPAIDNTYTIRTPIFTTGATSSILRFQLLTSWDGTTAASGVIKAYQATVRKVVDV